jgi:LysR family cys regulon transcriptional activator
MIFLISLQRLASSLVYSNVCHAVGGDDMKLQQLKYLLAIVDNGLNITAAAERLYTSQPGVSKQLKLLEEELGFQLFTRKGKSLDGITVAGQQVIGRARLIMKEVEGIRDLASPQYREQHGHVSVAMSQTRPS